MRVKHEKEFESGYTPLITKQNHPEMMGLEFGIVNALAGEQYSFCFDQEAVYVLVEGKIRLSWEDEVCDLAREDCFHEGATLLHVPSNTKVVIEGVAEASEIAVAHTENEKTFPTKLLHPSDCLVENEMRGAGQMQETSTRMVRTFFDRTNCPETNFYLGETVNLPGKWSSYPPHFHVEPEMYYYRMYPENGWGFAEYGEDAFKIHNRDLMGMPENVTHAQVVMPGYSEYYLWVIRLREEALVTNIVKEYAWVTDPEAKYFPEI
ncbi:MAG: 5-deoxy-glucuronate isomerase [Lachnospiraceae bacterium]|nr:5-deoxy-glucuronate isomerase [Lachnospiraceae bacterium]